MSSPEVGCLLPVPLQAPEGDNQAEEQDED